MATDAAQESLTFFAAVALMQVSVANAIVQGDPANWGGEFDTSPHPSSGLRNQEAGIIDAVVGTMLEDGKPSSSFAGSEMAALLERVQAPPTILASGDEKMLTSELPFLGRTSLLVLRTDFTHPFYGNGLLCELTLPIPAYDRPSLATEMNEREATDATGTNLLGTWGCDSQRNLTYRSFIGNTFSRPGRLDFFYDSLAKRARWVAEVVYGDDWDGGGLQASGENKLRFLELFSRATKHQPGKARDTIGRFFRRPDADDSFSDD